jgi:hypothetical protein
MDFPTVFLNHLLLSIVPWVAGGLIGGSLGYLIALAIRPLQSRAGLYRVLRLLPWRTIAFVLTAMAVYAAYPFILLGPVLRSAMPGSGFLVHALASISVAVLALALPFTTSIIAGYWFQPSLGERLVAGARTLGVASVVLALTAIHWGVQSAGWLIATVDPFDYPRAPRVWLGYGIVVSVALIVDLVMGVLQMVVARPVEVETGG